MGLFKHALLFLLFARTFQLDIRDESFLRFCGKTAGLETRGGDLDGLTCKVKWRVTTTQEEVEQLCKNLAPYPVRKSEIVDVNKPECTYENVYTCRPDYTQINGHCYRIMSAKRVHYSDAQQMCAAEKTHLEMSGEEVGSEIVDLFDEDLIRWFELYFDEMSSIWIQPRDDFKDRVEFAGDSDNYAIVYGMSTFYNIGPSSLIKMPTNHRAQAMCFYRPEETPTSFGYKAAKLGEFYWPTLMRGELTVWRTSGAYNYWNQNSDKEFAINQCKKSMAAIAGRIPINAFNPTKDNMKLLKESAKLKSAFNKAYAATYVCCYQTPYWSNGYQHYQRHMTILHHSNNNPSPFYCYTDTKLANMQTNFYSFSAKYHRDDCADRVGTFLTYPELVDNYETTEVYNRQDAPILCSIFVKQIQQRTKCPEKWKTYQRGSGRVVCHKVFNQKKKFDEAQTACRAIGGQLSTFVEAKEFEVLRDNTRFWIGGRKRSNCPVAAGDGECSKKNILVWDSPGFEYYSSEFSTIIAGIWNDREPNNQGSNEYCIEYRHDTQKINDLSCSERIYYSCIKDAGY
ncbi:unnamed protein product [Caenorhabditis angaria]|uniref:C-type lectin domain-containing protein n=1 Tax=Caenorhabditis angaria TaxID=860376 RepID=A0A9P1MX41_9PELO|nr:unnamed protein product [Caenorhabditis angaria]